MKYHIKLIGLLFILLANTVFAKADDAIGKLSGKVTDKKDGSPIIGATINIPDLKTGTITDVNGNFVFNIRKLEEESNALVICLPTPLPHQSNG